MDEIDRAQEREQEMRDDALAEFHRHHSGEAADSAEFCAHCEERIPEARRQAVPGCRLCVDCQAYLEMVMETGG